MKAPSRVNVLTAGGLIAASMNYWFQLEVGPAVTFLAMSVIALGYAAVEVSGWTGKRAPLPAGRCRVCGYDLRATPERCPECGTVVGKGGGA